MLLIFVSTRDTFYLLEQEGIYAVEIARMPRTKAGLTAIEAW